MKFDTMSSTSSTELKSSSPLYNRKYEKHKNKKNKKRILNTESCAVKMGQLADTSHILNRECTTTTKCRQQNQMNKLQKRQNTQQTKYRKYNYNNLVSGQPLVSFNVYLVASRYAGPICHGRLTRRKLCLAPKI